MWFWTGHGVRVVSWDCLSALGPRIGDHACSFLTSPHLTTTHLTLYLIMSLCCAEWRRVCSCICCHGGAGAKWLVRYMRGRECPLTAPPLSWVCVGHVIQAWSGGCFGAAVRVACHSSSARPRPPGVLRLFHRQAHPGLPQEGNTDLNSNPGMWTLTPGGWEC